MDIYLVIVGILFILAISDLMVGVSNDAVNFLNSAIGSKVAPRHVIMIVASVGILVGTTFSSGLMEVARKGIFHPDMFYLSEIMIIFLAVMLTDVILLDMFNTFGLPTSTTVSIVFELLGAAVAVSLMKIAAENEDISNIINYINTGKALAIISGILLSVIISFSVGAVTQFFTRILFSFNYKKTIKYFGSLWGGIALTAITYFILVKGAKGTSFLSGEEVEWIKNNTWLIVGISFLIWAALLQIIMIFTKANVLKGIVLVGTFALALAFAANDLVNFIGVPLAGLTSYQLGAESSNPDGLLMTALKGKVTTPTFLLLVAGTIMVITLWFSKKSRSVTKTEVNLGRQSDGFERFESSLISRSFVRTSVNIVKFFKTVTPVSFQNFVNSRFEQEKKNNQTNADDAPAFDLIRASNNLMVASILISIATSMKLPLSTTYVTFMVAMGTSLSDRAWGRESAVYRVNGVLTVIGGWFFTAFSAFTSAFIMAVIIFYGGMYAIIGLSLVAAYIVFRSHILHKKRSQEEEDSKIEYDIDKTNKDSVLQTINSEIARVISEIPAIYKSMVKGLNDEDRIALKATRKGARKLRKLSVAVTAHIFNNIDVFKEEELKANKRFGKVITNLQEIANKLVYVASISYDHINNNHNTLSGEQINELNKITSILESKFNKCSTLLIEKEFENIQEFTDLNDELIVEIAEFDNNQIARIKQDADSTRNSMLYLNLLSGTENIAYHSGKLFNSLKNAAKL